MLTPKLYDYSHQIAKYNSTAKYITERFCRNGIFFSIVTYTDCVFFNIYSDEKRENLIYSYSRQQLNEDVLNVSKDKLLSAFNKSINVMSQYNIKDMIYCSIEFDVFTTLLSYELEKIGFPSAKTHIPFHSSEQYESYTLKLENKIEEFNPI